MPKLLGRTRNLTVVCEFNFSGLPLHLRQKKIQLNNQLKTKKYKYNNLDMRWFRWRAAKNIRREEWWTVERASMKTP
jgi:hypothetical protein